MHDESVDEALKDLAVALEVRPSSEFAAGVWGKLEDQPVGAGIRTRWLWLGGAVAAAAVIAAGVWTSPRPLTPTDSAVFQATSRPAVESINGQQVQRVVERPRKAFGHASIAVARASDGQAVEVLVPPDQAIALRRLLGSLRGGYPSLPAEALAVVETAGLIGELGPIEIPQIKPVQIPLIKIEPLAALSNEEGEGKKL